MDEEKAKLRFGFSCRNDFGDLYNNTDEQNLNRMGISRGQLDFSSNAKKYFTNYFTIDENANATYFGAGNYETEITKSFLKLDALYMLHKFLRKKNTNASQILKQIFDGEIYVHDLHTLFDRPYCLGISLNMMRLEGLPFSELRSLPAKRSSTFMKQAAELVFILSNSFAGATAESDILVQYATFIENEEKSDEEIMQDFQEYIHTVNNKLRQSQQSPFTNVSIYDKFVLQNLMNDAGLDVSMDTIIRVQNLWMEFFGRGAPSGLPYRFPVTSINLYTIDGVIQDDEILSDTCEYGKKLAPFNFYCSTGLKYTSCCRLIYDIEKLRSIQADTWGAGLNMGSTRVCSLNLPYIALKSQRDKRNFYEVLEEILISSYNIHVVNREMLHRLIDKEFIPVFKPYNWLSPKMFFSTFGISGLYETAQILSPDDLIPCMKKIVIFIEKFANEKSELDFPLNVEFVPAETTASKLAIATNREFKTKYDLFSNQIVPLDTEYDLIDRMEITGQIAPLFSGGSLLHLNINEHITDTDMFKRLITMSVKEGVDHLALNYIFDMCKNMHGFVGEICPYCKEPSIDKVSRTVGFYVPVSKWTKMRQAEERQWY